MKFNFEITPQFSPTLDYKKESPRTLASFILFSPSLVSECLTREIVDVKQKSIRCISSDIDLLLRIQSGQRIDSAIAEELFSRMSSNIDDSLKQILDNASDDEILDSIRSRYIQTPSQLEAYLRSLDSRLSEMSSQDIQEVVEGSDLSPKDEKSVAEPSSE